MERIPGRASTIVPQRYTQNVRLRKTLSNSFQSQEITPAMLEFYLEQDPIEVVKYIFCTPPKNRVMIYISRILKFLKELSFFQELAKKEGEDALKACCQHLEYEFYYQGAYVFHIGEVGTKFYIILKGSCGVMITNQEGEQEGKQIEVLELTAGSSFGERAIMFGQPRAASIVCKQDTHLAVLDYFQFKNILGKATKRSFNQKVKFLQQIPCLSGLTKRRLQKMCYNLNTVSLKQKQVLFNRGELKPYLYLI